MPASTPPSLSDADRATYLRHLVLPEVGEVGQRVLLASSRRAEGDPRAASAAQSYLDRSGIRSGGQQVSVGDPRQLARLAGGAELEGAAALLLGAFAAVEEIKSILKIGRPGVLQSDLSLRSAPSMTEPPKEPR